MKRKWLGLCCAVLTAAMLLSGCGTGKMAAEIDDYSGNSYSDIRADAKEQAWDIDGEQKTDQKSEDGTTEGVDREVKLVYTCQMTVETLQYKETIAKVRELVSQYQGFVENETERDSEEYWYYTGYQKTAASMSATFVLRIPTENYNAFLTDVEGNGKVTERSSNVENITKRYYETQTTIQSLTIQEERLLAMMEEAKSISEMLEIEDRLTDVQMEIAQYKNSLASMDTDVNYSTVTLKVKEVLEYTPDTEGQKQNTFADRLKNTFENTWEGFKDFGEGLLFFLIEAGPYLVIFIVIPLVILLLLLKKFKKQKQQKEKKCETAAAPSETVKKED